MIQFIKRYFTKFIYLPKWILLCFLLGTISGTACAVFLLSLDWITKYREEHFFLIYLLPFVGFIIGWAYYVIGKGISKGNDIIIDEIQFPQKKIPLIMAPMIFVSTLLTHLFGGSAGREGTALQMSASLIDQFTNLFNFSDFQRKILLISAVAAGFGGIFGTPIAGAIFAMEFCIAGQVSLYAIFPAFLSAIIADKVTLLWGVRHSQFSMGVIPDFTFQTFCLTVVVAIIFGWAALAYIKSSQYISDLFGRWVLYPPFRPFIGGIIIVFLILTIGTTKYIGLGIPTISEAFLNQQSGYEFLFKLLFTVITLSSGFKGGEVTPLFFLGAVLGSFLSVFIPLPVYLLAAMGFIAVFSGATNTPLASLVLGIEFFGMEAVKYFVIVSIIAFIASGKSSIYKNQKTIHELNT
ncbi:MAG: chloride channel protein [Cytophagales bacterium]|nr:MAG: chloride channel protein [Cytophagales bacterium]